MQKINNREQSRSLLHRVRGGQAGGLTSAQSDLGTLGNTGRERALFDPGGTRFLGSVDPHGARFHASVDPGG